MNSPKATFLMTAYNAETYIRESIQSVLNQSNKEFILLKNRHEGRSWYSSHRGRLWIASTVQQPTDEEIKELENFYKVLYNRDDIPFPTNYPTGCILGCVDLTNVLPQEEYRLEYPDGESQSAYVFVCTNPHELFIKFPNKGQHKICNFLYLFILI